MPLNHRFFKDKIVEYYFFFLLLEQFEDYGRNNHTGARAWNDQLIRSGLCERPPSLVLEKFGFASHVTVSHGESRTAQPLGYRPRVIRVATHI